MINPPTPSMVVSTAATISDPDTNLVYHGRWSRRHGRAAYFAAGHRRLLRAEVRPSWRDWGRRAAARRAAWGRPAATARRAGRPPCLARAWPGMGPATAGRPSFPATDRRQPRAGPAVSRW